MAAATTEFLPLVLVRGFDPLSQSADTTYYGFNDGTVYPHKLGEDYLYEGLLIKFLKTPLKRLGQTDTVTYADATNAIRYAPCQPGQAAPAATPAALTRLETLLGQAPTAAQAAWLTGGAQLDPDVARRFRGVPASLWVYRYYDFRYYDVMFYAEWLQRVIDMVLAVTGAPAVNLLCHSMGGVIARCLIQQVYAEQGLNAADRLNKWVTLGSPHQGIAFDVSAQLTWHELEYFNAGYLRNLYGTGDLASLTGFDPARLLCVVGTNHAAYEEWYASVANQLVSWLQGQDLNRSDGLVKQTSAVLTGAHRAHVYKCHGGRDSLVTSREAFELATRFFFGGCHAQVRVESLSIAARHRGLGLWASLVTVDQEYYVGFSVKARQLDFYLNRQDAASENCFGPFDRRTLTADDFVWDPGTPASNGIVFEGFFNPALGPHDAQGRPTDLVFRFDTYVGERDAHLLGHSDTVLVSQQSYFQVQWPDTPPAGDQPPFTLLFYPRVPVEDGDQGDPAAQAVPCTYQDGRFRLDLDWGVLDPAVKMTLAITITADLPSPPPAAPSLPRT